MLLCHLLRHKCKGTGLFVPPIIKLDMCVCLCATIILFLISIFGDDYKSWGFHEGFCSLILLEQDTAEDI